MESKEQEHSIPPPHEDLSSHRWWSEKTVAIVTGSNQGIGFAMVKRLAELGLTVVLTARNKERGQRAIEMLRNDHGLNNVKFYELDVSDPVSIKAFVSWFNTMFDALDLLVNNAAVSYNAINENSVEHAQKVITTNFYGAKLLTESLLPSFRPSLNCARILNISSRLGFLNKLRNDKIREVLGSEELKEEDIDRVISLFLEDVKRGTWQKQGWPDLWTDYAVSKLALNAYSKVLAKRVAKHHLSVNCFCPGFTQTSMTRGKGTHTADDAAMVGTRLALLPPHLLPTGKIFIVSSNIIKSKL